MLVSLMALLVRQTVEANDGGRRDNGCSDATGMLTVCHTVGFTPVAHHVGATGVRSGTGLKRTIVLHQGEELLPNAAAARHSISTGGGGSDVSKSFPASN